MKQTNLQESKLRTLTVGFSHVPLFCVFTFNETG